MTIFQSLSRPLLRIGKRFDILTLHCCMLDNGDDQFFADVTYYYRQSSAGIVVDEITASFHGAVEISEAKLLHECKLAARGSLDVRFWEVGEVDRV